MFEIRRADGKGQGVFATQDIPLGTRILGEAPVVQLDNFPTYTEKVEAYMALATFDKKMYLTLTSASTNLPPEQRPNHPADYSHEHDRNIVGIFDNNASDIPGTNGSHGAGIFLQLTRINHSCIPNTCHSRKSETQHEILHALRDIKAGEELSIAYVRPFFTRSARQKHLLDRHGFVCDCKACEVDNEFRHTSERRRRDLHELEELQLSASCT